MRQRVVGILKLVRPVRIWYFPCQPVRHPVVAFRRIRRHGRRRDNHLRAVRLQQVDLVLAHFIRHYEYAAVPFDRRDKSEPDARIARGGFYDGATGLEAAFPFRRLDYLKPDPVLYTPAGI